MTTTWTGAEPPKAPSYGPLALIRIAYRSSLILVTILIGLALLLTLRLIERPCYGMVRPWTPWITQGVCRIALMGMGLRFHRTGRPMQGQGAIVANHSSWLDIFVLNASDRVYFVSKSEVSAWPGIGLLARATGTLFIARDPRRAKEQTAQFEKRLLAGQRLLFFPEGTSTDGLRVLPFKSTLFAAFFAPALQAHLAVQPVSVIYHAPHNQDIRTYGWWGDMSFGSHLLATLALPRQGRVEVVYHAPLPVAQAPDRKALAAAAESWVRAGHSLVE